MENFILKEAMKSEPITDCAKLSSEPVFDFKKWLSDLMAVQYNNGMASVKLTVKNEYKPDRIIRSSNGKVTVVIWADGEKTIVRRSDDALDDPYAAFCFALAKRICGSTHAMKKMVEQKTETQISKKEVKKLLNKINNIKNEKEI